MQRHSLRHLILPAAALLVGLALMAPAGPAGAVGPASPPAAHSSAAAPAEASTFSMEEIIAAGHGLFGTTTKGLAHAVETIFARSGRPSGYIIGEEAAGAFMGGLRYGEGTLYLRNGTRKKVYWQGPSVGFDIGGNGSRSLVLIYNIDSADEILDRFVGMEGSAYMIGGLGINYQSNDKLILAPIRTGLGARLGANIGYLKYTSRPTWNPF